MLVHAKRKLVLLSTSCLLLFCLLFYTWDSRTAAVTLDRGAIAVTAGDLNVAHHSARLILENEIFAERSGDDRRLASTDDVRNVSTDYVPTLSDRTVEVNLKAMLSETLSTMDKLCWMLLTIHDSSPLDGDPGSEHAVPICWSDASTGRKSFIVRANESMMLNGEDGARRLNELNDNDNTFQQLHTGVMENDDGTLKPGQALQLNVCVAVHSVFPLNIFLVPCTHEQPSVISEATSWTLSTFERFITHKYGQTFSRRCLGRIDDTIADILMSAELSVARTLQETTSDEQRLSCVCGGDIDIFNFVLVVDEELRPFIYEIAPTSERSRGTGIELISSSACLSSRGDRTIADIATETVNDIHEKCRERTGDRFRCAVFERRATEYINCRTALDNDGLTLHKRAATFKLSTAAYVRTYLSETSSLLFECSTVMQAPVVRIAEELRPPRGPDKRPDGFENDPHHREEEDRGGLPSDKYNSPNCSLDRRVKSFLAWVDFSPELSLYPVFRPTVSQYDSVVPYSQVLVTVHPHAMHCHSHVRIGDKSHTVPINYALSVGENHIKIYVVDSVHPSTIINKYAITVYRNSISEHEHVFDESTDHQVCQITQDCDLVLYPSEPCGTRPVPNVRSWPRYLSDQADLPACRSSDVPGRWVLPCSECTGSSECFWKEARWMPYSCQHVFLSRESVKECFAGKKLIFLGDSTNRGVMYYLMQQFNGTLSEWEKIHDMKTYSHLNDNRTSVLFHYHPQFWIVDKKQQLSFANLFRNIITSFLPLSNDGDTVLFIGGVQWLLSQHINIVDQVLQSEGLSDITKVVKGLGGGFHIDVTGVHTLTLNELRKLPKQDNSVLKHSTLRGYRAVSTFNMTMVRFRDFLQGKCACHFHKIQETVYEDKKLVYQGPPTGQRGQDLKRYERVLYDVQGQINAVYSELFINSVCSQTASQTGN